MPAGQVVVKVRRGEVSFPVTFWLWGVGGNMALMTVLMLAHVKDRSGRLPLGLWMVGVAWNVFVRVATRRSGPRCPGPSVRLRLSRMGLVAGGARLTVEAAPLPA